MISMLQSLRMIRRNAKRMIPAAAGRIALRAPSYVPLPPPLLETLVEQALIQGRLDEAASFARRVIDAWPDRPHTHLRLADILRRAYQFDAADDVLRAAMGRFPRDPHVRSAYAVNADVAGARDEALRRWQTVLCDFPDVPISYAGVAAALQRLKRSAEARDVLAKGLALFPDDLNLATNEAVLLGELGELEAALNRWRRLRENYAEHPMLHIGEATALRHLLHFDAADEILRSAMQRFPNASIVFTNYATNADVAGHHEEALCRWEVVLERFGHEAIAYAGAGAALKMLRRFDAADALMAEGIAKFPHDLNLAVNHAWVAVAREDWEEARRRWQRLAERWPEEPRVQSGQAETEMQASLARIDRPESEPPTTLPACKAFSAEEDLRTLALAFESLGENCELGFVQRHFCAEPLGLFRWVGISVNHLIIALETNLAGIGDEEFTVLAVNPHNREYCTEDRRYGMSMHTFMLEGVAPREIVLARVTKRLVFLRDKLLQDLQEGRKLFVINSPESLPPDDLLRLRDALHRHGPCKLLNVIGRSERPAGEIVQREGDIWEAALTRPGYNGLVWNIDFESWRRIMLAAAQMRLTEGLTGFAD